jgi:hypothetical protein
MTGLRLGALETFSDQHVLTIFQKMGALKATVSGHAQWGPNYVLLLSMPSEKLLILSELDEFSKPERDGTVYKYTPQSETEKLKEPHISCGKDKSIQEMFPVETTIEFDEAFIKKEGPHDPESRHIVALH